MERLTIIIVCICIAGGVKFSKLNINDDSWIELFDKLIETVISPSIKYKTTRVKPNFLQGRDEELKVTFQRDPFKGEIYFILASSNTPTGSRSDNDIFICPSLTSVQFRTLVMFLIYMIWFGKVLITNFTPQNPIWEVQT